MNVLESVSGAGGTERIESLPKAHNDKEMLMKGLVL